MALFGDRYERKARLAPALIVAWVPLTLSLYLGSVPPLTAVLPTAVAVALAYVVGEVVRSAGRRTERRLIEKWDGMPTTIALRHRGPGPATVRAARRAAVEQIASTVLPTRRRETAHPIDTDAEYRAAVKACITAVRTGQSGSDMLFNENRNYGFRRNLRAMKPVGVAVAVLCIIAAVILSIELSKPLPGVVVCGVAAAMLGFWIGVVRDSWVRFQADQYAEEFFATVEAAARAMPTPAGP